MPRMLARIAVILLAGGLVVAAQEAAPRPITEQDLLSGLKDPTRWLTFSGDYTGQRHSPLKQLTPQNVAGLVPQWVFQTDVPGFPGRGIETSPIVVDGVMYVTGKGTSTRSTRRPAKSCGGSRWERPCGVERRSVS